MKRFFKTFVVLLILGALTWYVGLKEDHYRISFTSKQPPGVVYQHILNWQSYSHEKGVNVSNQNQEAFSNIEQIITSNDSTFHYNWDISRNTDGQTKVTAAITDKDHGIIQKLQVPFFKNAFVKRSVQQVKNVGDGLSLKGKQFKVHSIKDTVFSGGYCIYLPIESSINKKAATMLYNITDLMGYIKENNIEMSGDPYLEVLEWNQKESVIKYNFCFPIEPSDSLPKTEKIQFKKTPSMKALKAEFNGNYKDSNNAWYYLLDYAKTNNIKVKKLPTELFLNDPHTGGDPITWKALIFLPLED